MTRESQNAALRFERAGAGSTQGVGLRGHLRPAILRDMSPRTHRTAGQGLATLLLLRAENMHAVADTFSADGLLRLLKGILDAVETRVTAEGGQVVGWDPSCTQGSTVVCAWIDGPQTRQVDVRGVAHAVMTAVRTTLDRGLPPHAPHTRVVVALCRGPCVYQYEGNRITMLLGGTMNDLHRLADSRPGSEDVLVVAPSVLQSPA